jgi:hypothetical protein
LSSLPSWKSYDSEFDYADEIRPELAQIMQQVESGPRVEKSSQQTWDEYYRLHELNLAARKKFRWENQDELKAKRTGRILHMNEFLGKLRSTGLNCWYTDKGGMAGTLGLYVSKNGIPTYIGFVQVPLMQEYEELHFDRFDVPLGPKRRGWRTILLKLIDAGFLTETEAHKVFGEPASGPVSRRYREYLKYIRNRKV